MYIRGRGDRQAQIKTTLKQNWVLIGLLGRKQTFSQRQELTNPIHVYRIFVCRSSYDSPVRAQVSVWFILAELEGLPYLVPVGTFHIRVVVLFQGFQRHEFLSSRWELSSLQIINRKLWLRFRHYRRRTNVSSIINRTLKSSESEIACQ